MEQAKNTNVSAEVDEAGFLVNSQDWNEKVACELAQSLSQPCQLTPQRLQILQFLRDYYEKFEGFPVVGYVCRQSNQSRECLYEEFLDPIQAWKIAGLPKATTEVLALVRQHRKKLT